MIQGQVQRPSSAQMNCPLRMLIYLGRKTI